MRQFFLLLITNTASRPCLLYRDGVEKQEAVSAHILQLLGTFKIGKIKGKPLVNFEANRDVWQEVLDDIREINAPAARPDHWLSE